MRLALRFSGLKSTCVVMPCSSQISAMREISEYSERTGSVIMTSSTTLFLMNDEIFSMSQTHVWPLLRNSSIPGHSQSTKPNTR